MKADVTTILDVVDVLVVAAADDVLVVVYLVVYSVVFTFQHRAPQ
jgi:hypothetical protein